MDLDVDNLLFQWALQVLLLLFEYILWSGQFCLFCGFPGATLFLTHTLPMFSLSRYAEPTLWSWVQFLDVPTHTGTKTLLGIFHLQCLWLGLCCRDVHSCFSPVTWELALKGVIECVYLICELRWRTPSSQCGSENEIRSTLCLRCFPSRAWELPVITATLQ